MTKVMTPVGAISLKNLSHHAYCLIGGDDVRQELFRVFEEQHSAIASLKQTGKLRGNPDFFDRTYVNFTIDDAREIKLLAGMKATIISSKKIFIIMMNGITVEAQNALLKLLEEPGEHTHFFLIIPSAHLLLPTVKSRLSFLNPHNKITINDKGITSDIHLLAQKFLKSAPKQKLDIVKELIDDISKEKRPKQDAIDLLDELEEIVRENGLKSNVLKLESILHARKYVTDRAPSLKMLLEYVALSLS